MVGVVTMWNMPNPTEMVTVSDLRAIQARVAQGRWREHPTAKDWVGKAVAEVLKLDVTNPAHKSKIRGLLRIWIGNHMFRVVEEKDERRERRSFVVVDQPASD